MPNADHVCVGHIISLFFTMRSFYMSVYDVIQNFILSIEIILLFFQNRPLPNLHWIKTSNNTHGYIRATVDVSVGPKPMNAVGYRARTLNDKRFLSFCIKYFI